MIENVEEMSLMELAKLIYETEKEYYNQKDGLDLLKAQYELKNDWETTLGKSKVTQKMKDAFVVESTEERKRKVDNLKCELNFYKMVYEIGMNKEKYQSH